MITLKEAFAIANREKFFQRELEPYAYDLGDRWAFCLVGMQSEIGTRPIIINKKDGSSGLFDIPEDCIRMETAPRVKIPENRACNSR